MSNFRKIKIRSHVKKTTAGVSAYSDPRGAGGQQLLRQGTIVLVLGDAMCYRISAFIDGLTYNRVTLPILTQERMLYLVLMLSYVPGQHIDEATGTPTDAKIVSFLNYYLEDFDV